MYVELNGEWERSVSVHISNVIEVNDKSTISQRGKKPGRDTRDALIRVRALLQDSRI